MKSKLPSQTHSCNLQLECKPLRSDFENGNVLADEFSRVLLSDDARLPVSSFKCAHPNLPYFDLIEIHQHICPWHQSSCFIPDRIPLIFIGNIADTVANPFSYFLM